MTAVTAQRAAAGRTLSADVRHTASGRVRNRGDEPSGDFRPGDIGPDYFRHYDGTRLASDAEVPRASA